MDRQIIENIAKELKVEFFQVNNTLTMLSEGNTVPMIARYRKEQTKGLDEEQILFIQKKYDYQVKLAERKQQVLKLIEEQGKLTDEIIASVNECTKLSQVDDIYRPYQQKKKTRAGVAIKNGLQPLADWMLSLPEKGELHQEAQKYLSEEIKTVEEAIQGAKDVIAEVVSDNPQQRWNFKDDISQHGAFVTKIKKDAQDEKKVYQNYYDYTERISSIADHRIMAIDRAEKEKVISVSFSFDEERLKQQAFETLTKGRQSIVLSDLKAACDDGCDRLLFPSIEREIRSELSERAQNRSIEIFSTNLEKLLLQAPLKGRVVLGFDPGYRNGCKLAVVDETGKMLTVAKVFPFITEKGSAEAKKTLLKLINDYEVQIVAIGNGTASRESEKLVAEVIKENNLNVSYAIVSEAGASVWSAQEEARKEFPNLAVEERSAISIARRLLDPLAELIKIDPKSIGVGQYQHDLPQKALSERLDEAIMKCVNRTGADLNTASKELLTHISGLNSGIAQEIVNYRDINGKFKNRQQLLNVKKLGEKVFTQCAGFLRIQDGEEPLDQTSIHPESYQAARALMKACNITTLGESNIEFPKDTVEGLGIDEYTLKDIEEAIKQPNRDYRDQFETALLKSDVLEMKDLNVGDKLSGTVRNVVDFGAFVDIGLHEDALVHVSRMSMIKNVSPTQVVSVGDIVDVWVYELDYDRSRVSLSLVPLEQLAARDAQVKYRKDRKKQTNKKKEPSMEEAMARLLDKYKKH